MSVANSILYHEQKMTLSTIDALTCNTRPVDLKSLHVNVQMASGKPEPMKVPEKVEKAPQLGNFEPEE